MPRHYVKKGPKVVRQYACPCCGHWQWGKSHYQLRPIAYRDVQYDGGPPKVLSTVYVDELGAEYSERGRYVAMIKLVIIRLVELLGIVVSSESKLRAELDAKKQQLMALSRRCEELACRADAVESRRPRKRVDSRQVKGHGKRQASLSRATVNSSQVRGRGRHEDGLGPPPPAVPQSRPMPYSNFFQAAEHYRPRVRVESPSVRGNGKNEDGL